MVVGRVQAPNGGVCLAVAACRVRPSAGGGDDPRSAGRVPPPARRRQAGVEAGRRCQPVACPGSSAAPYVAALVRRRDQPCAAWRDDRARNGRSDLIGAGEVEGVLRHCCVCYSCLDCLRAGKRRLRIGSSHARDGGILDGVLLVLLGCLCVADPDAGGTLEARTQRDPESRLLLDARLRRQCTSVSSEAVALGTVPQVRPLREPEDVELT
jgi:hypothetical protein